jgi:hypothetical protein
MALCGMRVHTVAEFLASWPEKTTYRVPWDACVAQVKSQ